MSLIFGTLVLQMVTLLALVSPLPHPVRSKFVDIEIFLSKLKNFKVGLTFSIILLGMQFMDCVNRLEKLGHVVNPFKAQVGFFGTMGYDQLASKFYSQRNLYLTGAVLYLMMSIYTVTTIIKKLVLKEAEYRRLKIAETSGEGKDDSEEILKYKKLIEQKDTDIATFRKQVGGLQKSYDDLNPAQGVSKDD